MYAWEKKNKLPNSGHECKFTINAIGKLKPNSIEIEILSLDFSFWCWMFWIAMIFRKIQDLQAALSNSTQQLGKLNDEIENLKGETIRERENIVSKYEESAKTQNSQIEDLVSITAFHLNYVYKVILLIKKN